MYILQTHRGITYKLNNQYLTQPRTFRVFDSSSYKEETNQVGVQSKTGTVNPDICQEDYTSMPSVNPFIEDVPDVIYKGKTGTNPNKNYILGKEADSIYQGKRMAHTESSRKEKADHVRTQPFCSSSHEEETSQLVVQSKTGTINPDIYPDDKICRPSVDQIIKDVPEMTYRNDVDSGHLGEKIYI